MRAEDPTIRPEDLFKAATARLRENHPEAAAALYRKILELRPDHVATLNTLGSVLQLLNRPAEAIPLFRRAARLAPRDPGAPYRLGVAQLEAGSHEEAIASLQRAVAVSPQNARAYVKLACAFYECNRIADAQRALGRALALAPNDAAVHYGIGTCLQVLGRFAEARSAFRRALALAPGEPGYWNAYLLSEKIHPGDPTTGLLETMAAEDTAYRERDRALVHFNLAKAYDDLQRHDEAFAEYAVANALLRAETDYDEAQEIAMLDHMAKIFSPEFLQRWSGHGIASEQPVFILGMPRSGTSLVEQILASHSAVFGAGELPDLAQIFVRLGGAPPPAADRWIRDIGESYLERLRRRAPQARRITDKMPGNFPYVGIIHLALPQAKIIHVRRDPLDTCLSCYFRPFTGNLPYTADLGELGRYWRAYDRLMAHWRTVLPRGAMLEIRYEEIVDDIETAARRMLDFCGLEWEPECLAFHRTRRAVRTASLAQVRQPLYRNAVGRAKAYQNHIGPLIAALADPDTQDGGHADAGQRPEPRG